MFRSCQNCFDRRPFVSPHCTFMCLSCELGFGSFLGIIGSNLIENKRQMLVASIVFISFGVIAAFCCAIVDGVFAARHIDLRPLYAGRCQYYSKSTTPPEAVCHPQRRAPCTPKIKTNTCFCCDLYNCGNNREECSRAGVTCMLINDSHHCARMSRKSDYR